MTAYRRVLLCALSLTLSLLLTSCGSGTPSSDTTPASARVEVEDPTGLPVEQPPSSEEASTPASPSPVATATRQGGITVMVPRGDELIIDKFAPRLSTFHLNSLAYEMVGMDEVEVVNVTYGRHGTRALTMDVYYPPGSESATDLPVVVFGMGYSMSKQPLRNTHFYTSWGKLVAAAGMAGIVYDTEQPDQDIDIVLRFIRENAAALRLDPGRVGIMSSSNNVPTVMSYLMQEGREGIHFAVYYYGLSITPDQAYRDALSGTCRTRGCMYEGLTPPSHVDPAIPIFVVKAGQDFVANINEAMDHFVDYARGEGATVTVVDYAEGKHGFDTEQRTEESARIIADTVAFMQEHLGVERGTLVLHNGQLITGTGDAPIPDGAVVVENGRIVAAGPAAEVTVPDGATLIDAAGGTILPGLIDTRASDLLNRLPVRDGEIGRIARSTYLENTLKGGVTTLRATGWLWESQQEIAEMRAALASLGNRVPTVIIAGSSLAHGNGVAVDLYADQVIGVNSSDEAREAVERLATLGVDQILVIQSVTQQAPLGSRDGQPPTLTPEQLATIVATARDHGLSVVGQAVFPDEAAELLAAGVEHLANWPSGSEPLPDALVHMLVDGSIPVASGLHILQPPAGDVRRFLDAGGTLVFGTFAPNAGPTSDRTFEFDAMAAHGVTPMEMILAATTHAAHAIGLGDEIGTIEPGKRADIIVVDGDPLSDFDLMGEVLVVVKNGEVVRAPTTR